MEKVREKRVGTKEKEEMEVRMGLNRNQDEG